MQIFNSIRDLKRYSEANSLFVDKGVTLFNESNSIMNSSEFVDRVSAEDGLYCTYINDTVAKNPSIQLQAQRYDGLDAVSILLGEHSTAEIKADEQYKLLPICKLPDQSKHLFSRVYLPDQDIRSFPSEFVDNFLLYVNSDMLKGGQNITDYVEELRKTYLFVASLLVETPNIIITPTGILGIITSDCYLSYPSDIPYLGDAIKGTYVHSKNNISRYHFGYGTSYRVNTLDEAMFLEKLMSHKAEKDITLPSEVSEKIAIEQPVHVTLTRDYKVLVNRELTYDENVYSIDRILTEYNKRNYHFIDIPNSLSVTELRSGRIYSVISNMNGQFIGVFKHLTSAQRIHKFKDVYGTPTRTLLTITDLPEVSIVRANAEQVEVLNRFMQSQVEYRRNRLEHIAREVKYNTRTSRRVLENSRNQDLRTQLFSRSLHDIFVKYKSQNTIAKTFVKLNKLGYFSDSIRNITIKLDATMTYTPSGKEVEITENNKWSPKGRQSGKYGKLLRKVLKEQVPMKKFNDHDLEKLVNILKSESSIGNFSVVSGEDIRHWYNGANYRSDNTGTLGSSCMRYDTCQDYLNIYVDNPQVTMVILTKGDSLVGRALVWENKYMDRIYGSDATIVAFKNYARDNDLWYRETQNSETDIDFISPSGEHSDGFITIELDTTDYETYPYLDTFCYLDRDTNTLTNEYHSSHSELRSTEGYLEDDDRVWDDWDDQYIDSEDAVYVEGRGIYTHYHNCVEDVNHEWILKDDAVELHDGQYIHEDDAIYCEEDGEYAAPGDVFYCEQDRIYYISSENNAVEAIDGSIVHEDNLKEYCEENDMVFNEDTDEWEYA